MKLVNLNSNDKPERASLSIIVPVYNEQDVLELFQSELDLALKNLRERNLDIEILYVNDGSTDQSWAKLCHITSPYADTKCLNLSRNFGKEAAVSAGLDACIGDAAILMDADLQDPPKYIGDMWHAFLQGFDVVNMQRGLRFGESKMKLLTAHLYYRLLNFLSDVPLQKDVGDFRLLSRRVIDEIKRLPEKNRYMKGIMSWPGFVQTTICFDRPQRAAGETKWSFIQLARLAVSGITAFSVKPLRLATWAGSLISLGAFTYGAWVLTKTLIFGEKVAGYPSMMLTMLFIGGVQLLAIGLLGEYVGRIFVETKARPLYVVMERTSNKMQKRNIRHG